MTLREFLTNFKFLEISYLSKTAEKVMTTNLNDLNIPPKSYLYNRYILEVHHKNKPIETITYNLVSELNEALLDYKILKIKITAQALSNWAIYDGSTFNFILIENS